MAKAGTVDDTAKIADALRAGQWDTIWGKMGFGGLKTLGAPTTLEVPMYISKFAGGQFSTVDSTKASLP
jgi:hypothetical protein